MCGIFAILGINNCYPCIIEGLKILQNRGYDSAGICSLKSGRFIVDKYATDNTDSISKLQNIDVATKHKNVSFCISHTRWATHGIKSDANSHPHLDNTRTFSIVHNGIIENYKVIKNFLFEKGYIFHSDTDSEVLVNLISFHYFNTSDTTQSADDRVRYSIQETMKEIRGTFGICLMCLNTPNSLYIFRRGSPLVFTTNESSLIVASEQSAIQKYTNNYKVPNENDIIKFTIDNNRIINDENINKLDDNTIELIKFNTTLGDYKHWTIKEINEINIFSNLAINLGGRISSEKEVKLGGLEYYKDIIISKENIIILGCGSSLFAAKFVSKYLSGLRISNNIQCINACEFDLDDYCDNFLNKTIFIFISQSGETYDLIKILNKINKNNYFSIGVVNKVGSYISKNTTCGVYANSGNEIGVAATKSYINQCIVLMLIGIFISQYRDTSVLFRMKLIKSIKNFCLEKIDIDNIEAQVLELVDKIYNSKNMFVLGSSFCEAIAGEGSLKIKELTYIHSESYSMGELKHGPLSLICDDIPVIFFNLLSNKNNERLSSSLSETKLRGSFNIVICDSDSDIIDNIDFKIKIKNIGELTPLLAVIPLQLIAYHIAIKKDINPDKPRNLAKTVTVE